MANCYSNLSVVCTFYLLCLLFVPFESVLIDEPYYRYFTYDSTPASKDEIEINFIPNEIKYSYRSRRSTHVLPQHPVPVPVNQTLSENKIAPIYQSSTNNEKLSTQLVPDLPHNDRSPNGSRSEVPVVSVGKKLQQQKEVLAKSSKEVLSAAINGSLNNSVKSVNNSLNNGQIISAEFDSTVQDLIISNVSDMLKDDKDTDIAINPIPDELSNGTLSQEDITKKLKLIRDTHVYYNSSFMVDESVGQRYWVDMSSKANVKVHDMLSKSHRRAATVQLSFNFPFYGHLVTNVTIATGGFLFTGDHVHAWLAATQYIAPLMANFDTRLSNDSFVKYLDNGTSFTVLWENVQLKDSPENGTFTFEATLHDNGDIVFVYKSIPVVVESIRDDHHPVKVGLSDAYIIDRTIFFIKRKTIYEYHRVNFAKEDIKNWTVIYLHALPTCRDMKDCESCVHADVVLECKWCPAVERCSTGLDRARQEWLGHECDKFHVSQCNEPPPPPHAHKAAEPAVIIAKQDGTHREKTKALVGTSGVVSLLLVVTSVAALAFLMLYAYRNPHSTPGQFLIRYRPSQWRWRRGEARYTAATIHM